jgi:hypothetical protein
MASAKNAGTNAKDPIVTDTFGVVVPKGSMRRDALMAGVGNGRSKTCICGFHGWWWKCEDPRNGQDEQATEEESQEPGKE